MIPESYKPSNGGSYKGPERRTMDKETQNVLHELSTDVKLVQQEIKALDAKVEQRLVDNRSLMEVQFSGIQQLLDQQRRDNEQRRSDDLKQHEDMIGSFKEQTSVLVDLYRNHEREQDEEITEIKNRISKLETAPAYRALTSREKIQEIVVGLLVTSGALALFAIIAAIARWDDLVKWIGGK